MRESCRGVPSDGAVKCKPDLPAAETRRRSRRTVVCYGIAVQKGSELRSEFVEWCQEQSVKEEKGNRHG